MEAQWMGVGSLWFGEAFRRRSVGLHKEYGCTSHRRDRRHTRTQLRYACVTYPLGIHGCRPRFLERSLPFASLGRFHSFLRDIDKIHRLHELLLQPLFAYNVQLDTNYTHIDTTWPKTTRRHRRSTACSTSAPTLDPISRHRRRESPSQKACSRPWTRTRRCGRSCPTVERKIRPTQTCDMRRMRVA